MTPYEQGELRHEQCRYGIFAQQAYRMNVRGDGETPFAMPLCGLPCPSDMPPWVARRWSGSIEFNRDCAVCPTYSPLTEATTANSVGTEADHEH